jgi:chromosomal replication initiation ATPase DnaA
MTIKEAKKELQDYFNLEMTPHAENKLNSILSSIKVKPERIIETKYVYIADHTQKKMMNLDEEATKVCEIYGITMDQLRGKRRLHNFVGARAHLIRHMRMNSTTTLVELAQYLNMKDHSSVIHLCYESKTRCMIKPLMKNKTQNLV